MLLFSRDMEIVEGQSSWQDVLKKLFQPRGRDGMGQGIYTRIKLNKLRGFKTSSDILQTMRKTVMLEKPLPEGTIFKPSILGLPIQYQKVNKNPRKTGDEKLAVDAIEYAGDKEVKKRRKASPLFISVHKEDDNNYYARALLMPSKIIDSNTSLVLTYNDKPYSLVEYEDFGELWNLLEGGIQ
jgi:CRISPR-associated protein Cmr1